MSNPNSFYAALAPAPEPAAAPAPNSAREDAMYPSLKAAEPDLAPAAPSNRSPASPDERAEAFFDAPIVPGKSDAFRAGTSDLIALGQLDAAAAAKAEVEILGHFRAAKIDGLAEVGIAARVGKQPPSPEKAKSMQADTLARIQREFGPSAGAVKQEIANFMAKNPALRDWMGGYSADPTFALRLADVVWARRKR